MEKVLEILIENFTNERLDKIAFRDKGFQSSDRELDESIKQYDNLLLPKEDAKVISRVFYAYAGQGARYAAIAYKQGIMDSVQLLKEIGVISDISPDKAAEYADGAGTDIAYRGEPASVRLIKKAARKIHDAGGCDAKDELQMSSTFLHC